MGCKDLYSRTVSSQPNLCSLNTSSIFPPWVEKYPNIARCPQGGNISPALENQYFLIISFMLINCRIGGRLILDMLWAQCTKRNESLPSFHGCLMSGWTGALESRPRTPLLCCISNSVSFSKGFYSGFILCKVTQWIYLRLSALWFFSLFIFPWSSVEVGNSWSSCSV